MSKYAWFWFPGRAGSVLLFVLILMSLFFQGNVTPVKAEGSRELVASGGKRALTEWRTNTTAGFIRRTFFRVYANEGEYILMGSSAMGLGLGDIVLYQEGQVSNSQISPAALAAITPTFRCSVAGGGILRAATPALTRSMELVGPTTNGGADGGYTPCVYTVPAGGTGSYWVAMYGPLDLPPLTMATPGRLPLPTLPLHRRAGYRYGILPSGLETHQPESPDLDAFSLITWRKLPGGTALPIESFPPSMRQRPPVMFIRWI